MTAVTKPVLSDDRELKEFFFTLDNDEFGPFGEVFIGLRSGARLRLTANLMAEGASSCCGFPVHWERARETHGRRQVAPSLCSACRQIERRTDAYWYRHRDVFGFEQVQATLEPHYEPLTAAVRACQLLEDLHVLAELMRESEPHSPGQTRCRRVMRAWAKREKEIYTAFAARTGFVGKMG